MNWPFRLVIALVVGFVGSVSQAQTGMAGFTLSNTDISGTTESGIGATFFSVRLNVQPSSNVVLSLTSSGKAISLSATNLTFTSENWNTNQHPLIYGVENNVIDRDRTFTITVSVVDTSSDNDFDNVPDQTLMGSLRDNDTAGFTPSRTALGTISENGGSISFTVALNAQPHSNVELTLTKSGKEVSLSATTLTFTSATGNWNIQQTITVSGVNNNMQDGDLAFMVTIGVDEDSSDDDFDSVGNQVLSGIVSDDEVPGFKLNPSGSLANIDEGGDTTIFTVVLNIQPANDVVIDVTSSDTTIVTVTQAKLTFTGGVTGNWNSQQTVTITSGEDDSTYDDSYTITLAIDDANSDANYNGVTDQTIIGIVSDNSTAGFTLSKTDLGTISENGGSTSFTVVLDAQPRSPGQVIVSFQSSGKTVSLNATNLTFTSANWDDRQTIIVSGVNNNIQDGDLSFLLEASISRFLTTDDNFDDVPSNRSAE